MDEGQKSPLRPRWQRHRTFEPRDSDTPAKAVAKTSIQDITQGEHDLFYDQLLTLHRLCEAVK